jgi:predicted ArsR family transcriptional regulator
MLTQRSWDDEIRGLLYKDEDAQKVFLTIADRMARSTTQLSADLGLPHDQVQNALDLLEKAELVQPGALTDAPGSAFYSITSKGSRAARSLRRMKR